MTKSLTACKFPNDLTTVDLRASLDSKPSINYKNALILLVPQNHPLNFKYDNLGSFNAKLFL